MESTFLSTSYHSYNVGYVSKTSEIFLNYISDSIFNILKNKYIIFEIFGSC